MNQARGTTILSGKKYDLEVILIIAINYSSSFQFLNSGATLFGLLPNAFKLVLLIRLDWKIVMESKGQGLPRQNLAPRRAFTVIFCLFCLETEFPVEFIEKSLDLLR